MRLPERDAWVGPTTRGFRNPAIDAVAMVALCALSLILYRQIALTNLVLPGADAIAYFYPYRAYAADAIREGRIPLWNPYLFLGVPFLANPQAGVFYPPNLLLAWLLRPALPGAGGAPALVAWSLVLHTALAAGGAYLYARRVPRLSPLPALLAASVYAFGGFLSGQAEHVNQLNVSAWFPVLLLLWEARHKARWPALLGLGGVIGIGLLAGHAQSSYITLAGLGVYAVVEAILPRRHGEHGVFFLSFPLRALRVSVVNLFFSLSQLGFALLAGLGLAAVQLLPTLELSRLSIRSGGLSYREAVAFSLSPLPRLLRYTFLPAWGQSLRDVFGGDFFAEYVAYVGVVPLLLAVWACISFALAVVWRRQNSLHEESSQATVQMIVLAALGVLLALGLYNPLYWVLFKVVPGFGLFRVPARWLLLYAFGVAMLAGMGLQEVADAIWKSRLRGARRAGVGSQEDAIWKSRLRGARRAGMGLQEDAIWKSRLRGGVLVILTVVGIGELLAASQALPLAHPTAPEAFSSLRTAPAHILAVQSQQAAPGRFISLSHTLFDPGDLGEIEQIYQDQLSPEAIYDLVVNVKRQEILAPNLPLAWRIYAVDGYDGGVLPLARYLRLQRLLLDEEDILSDGRLREGLERIPPSRLLSILGVQYAITDKVHDVWIDDIFYDLAFETVLSAAARPSVESADLPRYAATGLGIVTHLEGAQEVAEGTPVARIYVTTAEGETLTFVLHAGIETSEGVYDERAKHPQARIGRRWQRDEGETVQAGSDYVARLSWSAPHEVAHIAIEALPFGPQGTGRIRVRGISLFDARDGSNIPLLLSNEGRFRQVHSGDVKVYEALDALPRAYAVHQTRAIAGDDAALEAMLDPAFDPARTAILAGGREIDEPLPAGATSPVAVLSYEPEEVVLQASLSAPGYIVLSDSWYPGWQVTVDGQPAAMERANLAFRAVYVAQGTHTVCWTYRPTSYRVGLTISAVTLLAVVAALAGLVLGRKGRASQ